jgi:predicted small lipoprotein YifL
MRLTVSCAAFALLALIAGCGLGSDPLEGPPERVPGEVDPEDSNTLIVPDTVRAGIPFKVAVNTRGSSSCTSPADVQVTMRGDTTELVPYDNASSGMCTADYSAIRHDVELRLEREGHAVVRVGSGGSAKLERKVVVRP